MSCSYFLLIFAFDGIPSQQHTSICRTAKLISFHCVRLLFSMNRPENETESKPFVIYAMHVFDRTATKKTSTDIHPSIHLSIHPSIQQQGRTVPSKFLRRTRTWSDARAGEVHQPGRGDCFCTEPSLCDDPLLPHVFASIAKPKAVLVWDLVQRFRRRPTNPPRNGTKTRWRS